MSERGRPRPPDELDDELAVALEDRNGETLRAVAEHATALADWKDSTAETRTMLEGGDDAASDHDAAVNSESATDGEHARGGGTAQRTAAAAAVDSDEFPVGVPARANVSLVEIAGETYRYYQWREDDEIRSETERLPAE
ncbi:hypothetical protein [Natrialba asiatica]|uniref:Uncharacterized protein n=1 Tax=Natrialba asiatica (strain ATCC 700177 / DSM 12278 / JCM 9576 / FERM P-10747 / NBRC 102637 / 172P1) TaxID=29540 RepID=M0ASK8_NATA1|nr:hypothetical protein [Natrialba asiatica]ELZ00369.1 hypothetical protein C481_12004 [Natrialba asiatica DSM 12278]